MFATRHVRLVGAVVGGVLLATACGASQVVGSGSYGPLAVTASSKGGHDAHLGSGRLQITGECVTLENKDVLLVWRGNRVRWDQEARTILFQTVEDETLSLQDGDTVALGWGPVSEWPRVSELAASSAAVFNHLHNALSKGREPCQTSSGCRTSP